MNDVIKQLNAERINIVEADGTLRMALFNSQSMAPVIMDGENLLPGHREGNGESGIIFYNSEGDECGGMGFSSSKTRDGYRSSLSMTFDQYKQDQVVQMSLFERDGRRRYGYTIYDRPDKHLKEMVKARQFLEDEDAPQEEKDALLRQLQKENAIRMHLGKSDDGAVAVRLYTSTGQERLRVEISPEGLPQISLVEDDGSLRTVLP